jgi:glycosyltransferase involved in cell wall biosynthesis
VVTRDLRPLKAIRVIARLNVGGPARHVLLLDEALRRRGYDTLLVHGSIGPGEASLEHVAAARGLRTHKIARLRRNITIFGDAVALVKLLRLVFAEGPDVIHTHTAKAGALGRIAALVYNLTCPRARRCLVVHTFHGHVLTGYFGRTGNRLVAFAERTLAARTDRIVAISPRLQDDLTTRFNVAARAKTVVIPLGLDFGPLLADAPPCAARARLGLAPEAFVIAYVGRFVAIKALDRLFHAFAAVLRHVPRARLLMAGDGPTRGALEELARRLEIDDRVTFTGWTDDVATVYAAADVCCLPSLNEGTPVAIIEAMAAKRPVVATAVGGLTDLIDDERNGLLVPPNDTAMLARALLRLAGDPELRARVAAAARASVVTRFSIERLAADIHELYGAELVRTRRRRVALQA